MPSFPQNCLRVLTHCLWPNIDSSLGLCCKKHLFWREREIDSSQAEKIIEIFCVSVYSLALKIQFYSWLVQHQCDSLLGSLSGHTTYSDACVMLLASDACSWGGMIDGYLNNRQAPCMFNHEILFAAHISISNYYCQGAQQHRDASNSCLLMCKFSVIWIALLKCQGCYFVWLQSAIHRLCCQFAHLQFLFIGVCMF